jgi:hypothetical protein
MKPRILTLAVGLFVIISAGRGQYDEYIKKIGESSRISYVMYTDNQGNLYYINTENQYLDLMKYDLQSDQVIKIADNFVSAYYEGNDAYNEGFGAIAPTMTGDTVYCMTTAGTNHGNADVFRLICSRDTLEYVRGICGTNYWKIFNMSLAPDGKALYYIGNNTATGKALYMIDLETLECDQILDLDPLIPHRDLCFGGINVWDDYGHFYLPVWSFDYDAGDLAMLQVYVGEDEYDAQVLEFTDDGSPYGDRLLPGFRHHSCWSGIGKSSEGNIYLAASNHYQTTDGSGNNGNVAIYKWTPVPGEMSLLGDLKSVSESVNNWMPYESQHKVHSFLMENADGKMYFTTLDYYPSYLVRGSHIYTIDLETDEIADYSKTQPYVMKQDFSVVENTDQPSTTSGVAVEYYGIKGISLNPNVPDIMYGMTFSRDASGNDPGYVLKFKLEGDFVDISVIPGFETARIRAYPNPFDEQITFDFSQVKMTEKPIFRIYDMVGKLLYQEMVSSDQISWNGKDSKGSEAPQGLYIYSVRINSRIITGKIMKQ